MSDIEDELRRRILAERTADGTGGAAAPQPPDVSAPEPTPYYTKKSQGKGVLGAIVSALLLLWGKLKFLLVGFKLLTAGKLLLTFSTMLLSMWAYSHIFGWPFAVGIVLLIFIHECGHALAARMRGIPSTLMVFVPFMGAAVFRNRLGRNISEDAFIGIMGPVVGTLGCLACAALYVPTHNPLWLALAEWGFFVNLFNLAPTVPLDGGWIAPLFSPKLLAVGVVLLFLIGFRNPLIWILGLLSIPRIIGGWKADPKTQPYYRATAADRWKFGAAYFGLAAFLGVGYVLLHDFLHVRLPLAA